MYYMVIPLKIEVQMCCSRLTLSTRLNIKAHKTIEGDIAMTATCFEGISTNPEILAIADRVFETVRLSLQRSTNALNNVSSTTLPQKGIEKDAFDFLKTIDCSVASIR